MLPRQIRAIRNLSPSIPSKIGAGIQKAIELAPQAADEMQAAAKSLKAKELKMGLCSCRRGVEILEEIQKAQPQNEPPPEKKDDDKKDDEQRSRTRKPKTPEETGTTAGEKGPGTERAAATGS